MFEDERAIGCEEIMNCWKQLPPLGLVEQLRSGFKDCPLGGKALSVSPNVRRGSLHRIPTKALVSLIGRT